MQKDEISLSDVQRILFGEAPVQFLIETAIRTVVVYFFLLIVMRLLGKRMSGQLTITEMAIMLLLGATVSVGFQVPDRGVLASVLILFLIVLFHKTVTGWMMKNYRVEKLTQGGMHLLVKNGVLQLEEMRKTNISKEQLFSLLRQKMIYNLGKVKRVYIEACGSFSVYTEQQTRPGLSVIPEKEGRLNAVLQSANEQVCVNCGQLQVQAMQVCNVCGNNEWHNAVTQKV